MINMIDKVIIFSNGITRLIMKDNSKKEHYSMPSDRGYYERQGLKVEAREFRGAR